MLVPSISSEKSRIIQSSLTLSLLRCIVTEGTVYYDGIPTNTLNLDALRANITIIPQTVPLSLLSLLYKCAYCVLHI